MFTFCCEFVVEIDFGFELTFVLRAKSSKIYTYLQKSKENNNKNNRNETTKRIVLNCVPFCFKWDLTGNKTHSDISYSFCLWQNLIYHLDGWQLNLETNKKKTIFLFPLLFISSLFVFCSFECDKIALLYQQMMSLHKISFYCSFCSFFCCLSPNPSESYSQRFTNALLSNHSCYVDFRR